MKRSPLLAGLVALVLIPAGAGSAFAFDLGNHQTEVKTPIHTTPGPEGFDSVEGGETIGAAIPIASLPFDDTGATCDNLDDYDEVCPYTGSASPDVVYSWVADFTGSIDIDLCGSSYDTKVYVYENSYTGGSPYGCNDDYYFDDSCGTYVSAIFDLPVTSGNTYYIVVDGYSDACGAYQIEVRARVCTVPCNGVAEGEPTLVNDYVDETNGGCNSSPPVFQYLDAPTLGCDTLCAKSGWYLFDQANYRDTDWYIVTASEDSIRWSVTSEMPVWMFLLSPNDCNSVSVAISVPVAPCAPGYMTFPTTPGNQYWIFVAPQTFEGPSDPYEFDYSLRICGSQECDATQPTLVLGDVLTVDYTPPLWEVQVRLTNNGPGEAWSVNAEMGSDLAWLQIPDATCSYGDLMPGEHSYGEPGDASYVFDLANWPGGSFNAWFDVVYIDSCDQRHLVHLDPDFLDPEQATGVSISPPIAATRLFPNRPNPFNPQTTISFEILRAAHADVTIFNTAGQLVRRLWAGDLAPGEHSFVWSGSDDQGNPAPSGAYFYRLQTDDFTATKRMTLVR